VSRAVDYRKFLNKKESLVLPYLGGPSVFAESRRLRVTHEVPPGWWRFDIEGRKAVPNELVDPPDLSHLPVVRGHFVRGFLFPSGQRAERLALLPVEEPPVFALLKARRWPAGALLFDALEFESEAEDAARRALEEQRSLADQKGIPASLRAAFGYAVVSECSRRLGIGASPAEVKRELAGVAEAGTALAEQILHRLDAERRMEALRVEARRGAMFGTPLTGSQPAGTRRGGYRSYDPADPDSVQERAAQVLSVAGATLAATRRLDERMLEVTFSFMGERFISVVDVRTFQVLDAGICLSGRDELVTLDSLPSVIKEAIDTDQLNITRR
jgi:hypothetical protein